VVTLKEEEGRRTGIEIRKRKENLLKNK